MVDGVGQLADDAHAAMGIHGGGEDHGLEVVAADSLTAAEGHQESACRQHLHSTLIDGAVAFKPLLE